MFLNSHVYSLKLRKTLSCYRSYFIKCDSNFSFKNISIFVWQCPVHAVELFIIFLIHKNTCLNNLHRFESFLLQFPILQNLLKSLNNNNNNFFKKPFFLIEVTLVYLFIFSFLFILCILMQCMFVVTNNIPVSLMCASM